MEIPNSLEIMKIMEILFTVGSAVQTEEVVRNVGQGVGGWPNLQVSGHHAGYERLRARPHTGADPRGRGSTACHVYVSALHSMSCVCVRSWKTLQKETR